MNLKYQNKDLKQQIDFKRFKLQDHILQKYQPLQQLSSNNQKNHNKNNNHQHLHQIQIKVKHKLFNTYHIIRKYFLNTTQQQQNHHNIQKLYRQISYLSIINNNPPNIIKLSQIIKSYDYHSNIIYIVYLIAEIKNNQNNNFIKNIYLNTNYSQNYNIQIQNLKFEYSKLSIQNKKHILYQVSLAIFYLHSAQLIHRNIQPSSIILYNNPNSKEKKIIAKLSNFQNIRSVYQEKQEQSQQQYYHEQYQQLSQYIGNRWYRPPEALLGSKHYSKPVDIWSFGCLVAQLFRNQPIFPGTSTLNQLQRILSWTGTPSVQDIKSLKSQFGVQILDLFSKINIIKRKQWIPSFVDSQQLLDLLNKTLQFNPQKRISIQQIVSHSFFKQFYNSQDLIKSKQIIKLDISDSIRLSIKDYKILIFNEIQKYQKINKKNTQNLQSTQNNHKYINKLKTKHLQTQYDQFQSSKDDIQYLESLQSDNFKRKVESANILRSFKNKQTILKSFKQTSKQKLHVQNFKLKSINNKQSNQCISLPRTKTKNKNHDNQFQNHKSRIRNNNMIRNIKINNIDKNTNKINNINKNKTNKQRYQKAHNKSNNFNNNNNKNKSLNKQKQVQKQKIKQILKTQQFVNINTNINDEDNNNIKSKQIIKMINIKNNISINNKKNMKFDKSIHQPDKIIIKNNQQFYNNRFFNEKKKSITNNHNDLNRKLILGLGQYMYKFRNI